ncbi:MAG: Asp-tRNA(Asn)/Glu-tRNA(Gln) amidotransferase subunit GatA [Methanophagales archaeon]|nr:Asp-tRNA(Asn)/Glu-tRNA(Gln) amidotransferase subunit GatA [Methanophagales archaeon]
MMSEMLKLTAIEVVAGIKSGAISCEELVSQAYEQIAKNDLNSYITLNKENALETARDVDKRRRGRGEEELERKKLLGVPIAIKDSISTMGIQTTCASNILTGYVPPYDATVIEALKREGAIIIGKTNMDEFCMGTSTETSYYGATKNPHDTTRVPGGSSGGSAVAVSAGEAILALGSDTGGSIRCPASFCGIVGLKPTYGLVSRYGLIAYGNSLEQIGPMAATVADTALLLEVISVKDDRDSTQVKLKNNGGTNTDTDTDTNTNTNTNYCCSWLNLSEINELDGMRIGVPVEFFEGCSREVEKSVWAAIHVFEDSGATYEEISMQNLKYALASYYIIAMSEASSNLARFDGLRYGLRSGTDEDWHTTFSRIRAEGFGAEVKRRIILGTYSLSAGYYGRYYLKALKVRTLIKAEFEKALKTHDILMMPTMPFVAFKLGERIKDPLSLYLADINTVSINLAGVPSISVPCGYVSSDTLPVGLQIVGKHFEEDRILKAAFEYEKLRIKSRKNTL